MAHDPFDPENNPTPCPSCQTRSSSRKLLRPVDPTTRRCDACGRIERWTTPNRKVHGDRRYQRLVARQRKKFGKLDLILPQWIADAEE